MDIYVLLGYTVGIFIIKKKWNKIWEK